MIAFDSFHGQHWEIYIADVAERKPRKLVTNILSTLRPSWSRDGKWIYFVSHQPGNEGVYRCPAAGGDATLLSKDVHGFNPQESFDEKTVYFASDDVGWTTLKQLPVPPQPGTESDVSRLPRTAGDQLCCSLPPASILSLLTRPGQSGTLSSPPRELAQSSKSTVNSVPTFRSLPMAVGSSIRRKATRPATSCSSITFGDGRLLPHGQNIY